jgi:hypothetical protein
MDSGCNNSGPFSDLDPFFQDDPNSCPNQDFGSSNSSSDFSSRGDHEIVPALSKFTSSISDCSSASPSQSHYGDAENPTSLQSEAISQLLEEQNLKKQRLARKAELARLTRKRKNDRLSELEAEVKRLQTEVSFWKDRSTQVIEISKATKNPVVDEVVLEEERKLNESIQRLVLASKLNLNSIDQVEMTSFVSELVEVFNKKGLTSKSKLASLETSLNPCMPLRFLNWALSQDEKFYDDPDGLWNNLFKKGVKLSDEQISQLLALRKDSKEQLENGRKIDMLYRQFKAHLNTFIFQSETNLEKLRCILSAEQLAQFFAWVEQNQLCVKMLEAIMMN